MRLRPAVAFLVVLAVCHGAGAGRIAATPPVPRWDLLTLVAADPARPAGRSVGPHQEYGATRQVVAVRVPDRLAYPLVVPPGAVLDFGFAVQATRFMAFSPELADPVRVRALLTTAGGEERVLFDRAVDVREKPDERHWFDARVDLGAYAGQTVTLALEAAADRDRARGETTVLLSAPRVVTPAGPDEPSLLLVTIDCLRADHLGAWGYARPTSPRLDALAAEGVRFAHAYTAAPMTIPSIPQIFTGRVFPLDRDETFIGPIARAGIPSAAIVNNVWILIWLTLSHKGAPSDQFDLFVGAEDMNAREITDRAIAWLDTHGRERTALFLHYLDAHSPYVLPPPAFDVFRDPAYRGRVTRQFDDAAGARAGKYDAADQARVVSFYDASVRFVDEQLGRLLDHLRTTGRLDRTLVVVTADHGEELWDHGGFFHGQSLFDELLHVPLIVRLPGGAHGGTVVRRQVRSIDVAPGLLGWMGLPVPATSIGRPLAEALAAPDAPGDDLVATATNVEYPTRYALRTPTHKLIDDVLPGTRRLYDLASTPRETRDVLAAEPEVAAALAARLDAAREPLRHRGFQLRIVGAASGARFRLVVGTPTTGGRFATLDRVGAGPDVQLELSTDWRTLSVEGRTDPTGRAVRFDRDPIPFGSGPDTITITLEVDGTPAEPAAVQLGEGTPLPPGRAVEVLAPQLAARQAPACPPPATGARVCLWRWPDAGTPGVVAPDAATAERLRALGYVQ